MQYFQNIQYTFTTVFFPVDSWSVTMTFFLESVDDSCISGSSTVDREIYPSLCNDNFGN